MPAAPSLTCPYLGLQSDPHSVSAGAAEGHRCFAGAQAQAITAAHQQAFCLTRAYPQCPRFRKATTPLHDPQTVAFSPEVADPSSAMQSTGGGSGGAESARATGPWLDRIVILVALGAVAFAVLYFGSLFLDRPAAAPVAQRRTGTPSPAASRTPTATATGTPRPTATALPVRPSPNVPLPAGAQVDAVTPMVDGAGWVSSAERTGNHLGDRTIQAGMLDGVAYFGLLQFDLAVLPPGGRVVSATLELTGAQVEPPGHAGSWHVRLVNLPSGTRLSGLSFDDARSLSWDLSLLPVLSADALGKGKAYEFVLPTQALAALEQRLGVDKLTFRIDGPQSGEDAHFAWESGLAGSSAKPTLRLATTPFEQAKKVVVIACVPTPQSPAARAAAAATATAQATTFGTATAYPSNYVTQVPVTPTSTPETIFAAATSVARATANAARAGTATPTPPNWVVVQLLTATPEPANEATAVYRAALATALAATTGTPTPLPCFVSVAPTPTATPLVVYDLPTATATAEPTQTPSAIPEELRGKIAFMSDRAGTPAPYVMEPDGTRVGRLTSRWAYDLALQKQMQAGDVRLVVTRARLDITRLELVDSANLRVRLLVENGALNYDPAFAPNGVDLAFVSTLSGRDEIYRMDREGLAPVQLTNSDWEWNKKPSWSPDGTRLVWWSNRVTGRMQIWVMYADGSGAANLSRSAFNDWDPVWFR